MAMPAYHPYKLDWTSPSFDSTWYGTLTTTSSNVTYTYPAGVATLPPAAPVGQSSLAWLDAETEAVCKLARS